jgi:cytochrome c-type biogenesis protein CcmH
MNRRGFLMFRQEPVRPDSVATPRAGQGAVGTLFNPDVAGRPRAPTLESDNDVVVRNTELKLGCTCGCTLDVFTCRTTDFTCTYSPALHREVVALFAEGKTSEQVIAAFVDKYGEKILMAPKPVGFNLAGYVVPGAAILAVGGIVAWIIRRRVRLSATRVAEQGPAVPVATSATNAELERLEHELAEMEK